MLTVDLDPQGNLSDYFDVPRGRGADGRRRALGRREGQGGDPRAAIIPSSLNLAEVERALSGKMGREVVLKKALKDARKAYDVILIDCPPALGLLTINGLVAADHALISSEAQYFALQGVNGALELIEQVREYYNDDLEFLGVLLNIADMRTTHSRDAYTQLQEVFGEKVFATRDPLVDRLRGVRREGALDPGLPPRPRGGLSRAGRRGAVRIGREESRGALAPMLLH